MPDLTTGAEPLSDSSALPNELPLLETKNLTRHFKVGGNFSRKSLHAVDDANIVIDRQDPLSTHAAPPQPECNLNDIGYASL